MKNIGIQEPCSENWNEMTPTEKGAFCQKCATQVYDFTNKSGLEIKQTLRSLIGQPVCGRINTAQEEALNAEFEAWAFQSKRSVQSAFVLSLIVVFGFALFSCSHEPDRKQIEQIRRTAIEAIDQQQAEIVAPLVEASIPSYAPEEVLLLADEQFVKESPDTEVFVVYPDVQRFDIQGAMMMMPAYEDFLVQEVASLPVELDETGHPYPQTFEALAFPNPATAETTLQVKVPLKTNAEINLYDMNGRFLREIHSGELERGTFQSRIDLADLISGMYIVTIYSKDFKETVRISKL